MPKKKTKKENEEVIKMIEDYQEIFDSLVSCGDEENCKTCPSFSECLHYLRQILALLVKDKIDHLSTESTSILDSFLKKKKKELEENTADYFR